MVLNYIRQIDGVSDYDLYTLTDEEKRMFGEYIELLPSLYREVLQERLLAIYFVEDLVTSGLTDFVLSDSDDVYSILFINPKVFELTISELITFKDQSCFIYDHEGPILQIDVSGDYSGLLYILMHEATHIVDYALGITPYTDKSLKQLHLVRKDESDFVSRIWQDYDETVEYLFLSFPEKLNFYSTDEDDKVSFDHLLGIYQELRNSPFVSLYSTINWAEDLAEYATFYYFTNDLNMDYKITIRENGTTIFDYSPFSSSLVVQRADFLDIF